jgi:hypothetical protein
MPMRTQTSTRSTAGRFNRPGRTPAQRTSARRSASTRRAVAIGRRPPQKSGMAKATERIAGMLPGVGSKPSKRRGRGRAGKGTAGVALLAGAVGLAMKNREKLMPGRRDQPTPQDPVPSTDMPSQSIPG